MAEDENRKTKKTKPFALTYMVRALRSYKYRQKMATKANDNKKVLVATWRPKQVVFKLPDGLDIDDEEVVTDYEIDGEELTINFVDGKTLIIEGQEIHDGTDPEPDDIKTEPLKAWGYDLFDN